MTLEITKCHCSERLVFRILCWTGFQMAQVQLLDAYAVITN